jgi:choline dehydrogenase-like flavoprotein
MDYDVAIVGAGIAGAMIACKLAESGVSVALIEAGHKGESIGEMFGRFAKVQIKIPSSPYDDGISYAKAPAPKVLNDSYYDQDDGDSDSFKSTYLRRIGGTTWHWLGNVPRFVPEDFKLKSTHGVGCDWPISYDDLEPWYCEAEREIGVSGNHAEWDGLHGAYRSEPFPMPPIALAYSDKFLYEKVHGTSISGVNVHVNSTPQARNSKVYQDRMPCAGSASCVPLCPTGAKYNASIHVNKAVEAGARLLDKCIVTRVITEPGTGKVTSLRYQTWEGSTGEITAKRYVIAAHAVETAKLLLMSNVANRSDQVGRNLMDHLNGAAGAILPEPLYPFRGPPTTSGIDSFRVGDFRREKAAFRMSIGNNAWGRIESPEDTLSKLVREENMFGQDLCQALHNRIVRMFRISYTTEMLPNPDNRVTLSTQTDSIGLPRPKLHFKVDDYNFKAFEMATSVIQEIFGHLDAEEVQFSPDLKKYKGAGHIMGTCRMGTDPLTSVVDPSCRSHDLDNLFIVGASVFPTSGTANPTLTVAALALRVASKLRGELE